MKKKDTLRITTCRVIVDGRPVRYRVVGEGEPVILVHGLCASSLWWMQNIAALASSYRLYLVDLPGFGSMAPALRPFKLQNASPWLFRWMQAVGIEKAHLIGHSMGGYICLWVAAHHPEMVSRLVLVSPAVKPEVRTVFGFLKPLLIARRDLTPLFSLVLFYDMLRTGPVTFLRATLDLLQVNVQQELGTVFAPTLLVWGERDTLVPLSTSSLMLREMQQVRLHAIPRSGHVSMFETPEKFNSVVLAFLKE